MTSPKGSVSWLRLGGLVIAGAVAILAVWTWAWLSEVDYDRCWPGWKGRIVYEKLTGHLSYISWRDVHRRLSAVCFDRLQPHPIEKTRLLDEKQVDRHKFELFQTEMGKFWMPAPGKFLLTYLIWEMTAQGDYESDGVRIRPGDTVIDCGAHVGVYCRYALQHGAARVVAIEPDPVNLRCLEWNFASEIAAGQVIVVPVGVWHERTHLPLFEAQEDNSGGHSFVVVKTPRAAAVKGLLVMPLDDIVEQLKLERVDFIKMDIEGSERFALRGAAKTIARFRPRMAICTYHLPDDITVIPQVVQKACPHYRMHAKDIDIINARVATKVLFFQ